MTTESIRERINEDTLQRTHKLSSSSFGGFKKTTRSCYACSTHHPQNEGVIARLLGRSEFFCSRACLEKILKPREVKSDPSRA